MLAASSKFFSGLCAKERKKEGLELPNSSHLIPSLKKQKTENKKTHPFFNPSR
jgi:hypothetical protein